MKVGVNGTGLVQSASISKVAAHAQAVKDDGFGSYWIAEHPTGGFDALTVLAGVGMQVPELELGTAIVPTMPRHPLVLAGQAATVGNLLEGRLTLGVGLSHAVMMEDLGIGFDKPIRHLREYLSILMPLLSEGSVAYEGDTLSAQAKFFKAPTRPVRVLVAALGPQALGVCGRLAHGTILAWVGPKTIREHIAPRLREAAADAGKDEPHIVASLPVCVTDNPEEIRARIGKGLSMYGQLPSYRSMFDREGVGGPEDVAIVGSLAEVEDGVAAMMDAGVTEFSPTEFVTSPEEAIATRQMLKQMREKLG